MLPTLKSEAVDDSRLFTHASRCRDKVVLITGAATGIGRRVALAFAEHGAKIVIGDLNGPGALEVVTGIEGLGGPSVKDAM